MPPTDRAVGREGVGSEPLLTGCTGFLLPLSYQNRINVLAVALTLATLRLQLTTIETNA